MMRQIFNITKFTNIYFFVEQLQGYFRLLLYISIEIAIDLLVTEDYNITVFDNGN